MRYYDYFEVTNAARAFTGGFEGDFDLTALINVLFEEVPTHPEREYTNEEVQACDVTAWQTCNVPTSDGATMRAERWFTPPKHGPVHVGAWEDADGAVSLTLATVERGGLSPWNSGCEFIADSDKPDTWGELDWAYGSRKAWETDLATVERMIRAS